MTGAEIALLRRAHQLFGADVPPIAPVLAGDGPDSVAGLPGTDPAAYRVAARRARRDRVAARHTDDALTGVLARARNDHVQAWAGTRDVLEQARADAGPTPDSPLAQREAMRRRAARLRAQHRHVLLAQRRARRHTAGLRALTYRRRRGRRGAPSTRARMAVRAALSRLGRPYVWGATGPDRFDCSGLTQWSYAQAGIHLDRTTYQQLHDGVAVPRAQVRAGDLIFPNPGHVQLAIGNNRVVEASHPGAPVRIAPLGTLDAGVQIRRPG